VYRAVQVGQAFEELVNKILETPGLLDQAGLPPGMRLSNSSEQQAASACSC
jgi:hypothetical protein